MVPCDTNVTYYHDLLGWPYISSLFISTWQLHVNHACSRPNQCIVPGTDWEGHCLLKYFCASFFKIPPLLFIPTSPLHSCSKFSLLLFYTCSDRSMWSIYPVLTSPTPVVVLTIVLSYWSSAAPQPLTTSNKFLYFERILCLCDFVSLLGWEEDTLSSLTQVSYEAQQPTFYIFTK